MTPGSLRCDLPRLEPDDDFVERLAELAAASRPSRGVVVVPMAVGGPASRAVAVAAAVAAITAGAAAAASQLGHSGQEEPAPPITSVDIQRPDEPAIGQHQARQDQSATVPRGKVTDATTGDRQDSGDTTLAVQDAAPPVQHRPVDTAPGTHDQGDDPGADPSDDPGDGQTDNNGGDDTGDGDSGDDLGSDDTGSGDQSGSDDGGTDGDTGVATGGDGGGGDAGGTGDGTSSGGSQDVGGTLAGVGIRPRAAVSGDPSAVLIGSSD